MATVLSRIFLRRDSAAKWGSANPTLSSGEPGYETDAWRLRIGTGALAFNSLRAFLSVPTGAITVAQALLNATTTAAQRAALGLTGDIVQINTFGGTPPFVTDWDNVHAAGTGFYQANGAAANRPEDFSYMGIYTKNSDTYGVLRVWMVSAAGNGRSWERRYLNGVWEPWHPIGGGAVQVNDWNDAIYDGHYFANTAAANSPEAVTCRGVVVTIGDSSDVSQIVTRAGADRMWWRRRNLGVWSSWVEVPHSGNLASMVKAIFASVPYVSTEQTITPAGLLTLAHGLGVVPSMVAFQLSCQTAEGGYAIGDKPYLPDSSFDPMACRSDATNVYVRFNSGSPLFRLCNKTTGTPFNLTNASWRLIVRAYP